MPFKQSKRYDFWATVWRKIGAVYGVQNTDGSMIYVGQTDNLKERMTKHRSNRYHCMHRYQPKWVVVEVINGKERRMERERELIEEYDPPCNKL